MPAKNVSFPSPLRERGTGRGSASSQLLSLAVAMILGMTPWFSANVVSAAMAREWGASTTFQSWLTMAVQLGFVAGTLVSAVLMLSDRLSTRRLAGISALFAAAFTAAMTTPGLSAPGGIGLRLLAGAALAGVYPPGMKIAAGWWRERRGMAIGVLVGALTLGSAAPNLLRVAIPADRWRTVLLVAATACAISGLLFLLLVREGPYQAPSQPFDLHGLRLIARTRGVRLATGGYLGHMWELYAMWSAMAAFWAFVAQQRGLSAGTGPALAFATIAMGAPGCVIAGLLADRWGRATVTIVAMALSGACCLWVGGLINGPLSLLIAVSVLWGLTIVADSAQFSALVTELAPESYVGTALTIQTCLGFLLTMITIRLLPIWAAHYGWTHAFMPLAIGPAFGILAMRRLQKPRA